MGEASPLAKLIKKHLQEGAWEEQLAASPPAASTAFSSFWKKQAQQLAASFQATLADVAALEDAASAGSFEEAWPEQKQQEASVEQAGRIDGSDLSLGGQVALETCRLTRSFSWQRGLEASTKKQLSTCSFAA